MICTQAVLFLPDHCVCVDLQKKKDKTEMTEYEEVREGDSTVFYKGCTPHSTLHRCVRCKLHCDVKKGHIALFQGLY